MPWKKGQSGNPNGRKKGVPNKATASLQDIAQEFTGAAVQALSEIVVDKEAPPQARVAAANALLDRGYGRPKQTLETNLNAGATFLELVGLISSGTVATGLADEQEQPATLRDGGVAGNA